MERGEPLARLELATYALRMRCSSNCAIAAIGSCLRGAKVHFYLNLQKDSLEFLKIILGDDISVWALRYFLIEKLDNQMKRGIFVE